MIVVKNKADCCGCTACYSVCPKKAISMQQDQEGFLYPFVEISKCIDCKLCDSACPIENKIESKMFDRKAYVLRAKDVEIVSTSTSGGFVTPLGEWILNQGGVICGATYNEEYKVVPLENDKDIPTGFGKTEIVLSGHVITAYATEDNLEHKFVLIYCKCGRQEPEFYLYDTENDSFMPYDKVKAWYKESIGNTVVGSDSVSETKLKTMKYIVGIMVIICLLMFIGMITIYLHYRQNNNIISAYGGISDGSAGGIDNAGTVDSTDTIEYMGKIKHTYGENMPKFDSLKDGMSKKDVSGTDISEKEMLGDNNEKTDLDSFEEKSNNITHYWHRE